MERKEEKGTNPNRRRNRSNLGTSVAAAKSKRFFYDALHFVAESLPFREMCSFEFKLYESRKRFAIILPFRKRFGFLNLHLTS